MFTVASVARSYALRRAFNARGGGGVNQELITPDVSQAAAYIAAAWQQGIENIIETGNRLIKKREQFKKERGKWSLLIGDHGHRPILPFGKTHAYRLIAIAESARLLPHVGALPSTRGGRGREPGTRQI